MEEKSKVKIVAGIDIFVAVILLIVGFLVILLGSDWNDYISPAFSSPYGPPAFWSKTPWIIIFLGLCSMIYGVKRLIDNILKMV